MACKLQSRCTTLLTFLAVASITSLCSQESERCLQDCSWTSYSNGGKEVKNECDMLIPQHKLSDFPECPNIYESYSNKFSPKVDIVNVSYYDYPAKGSHSPSGFSSITDDETTLICVNISFQIAQSGADHVKAIRLNLIPATYTDNNQVYCQIWNMTTELTGCSFSAGHCDANTQYTFHYDCFCGLGASAGKHQISVDTLPKKAGQDHYYTNFDAPTCEDHPTNVYCQQTPKEQWIPLHSSSKQWCNNTRINVTFDLAPWEYNVQEYYVFLYKSDKNCTNPHYKKDETLINAREIETFENNYLNQTFNMTTVTFEDLEFGETYIAGFRINDVHDDESYLLKRVCSSMVTVKYPPCSINPCSANETCIPDCLTHTCQCKEGTERVHQTCQLVLPGPAGSPGPAGLETLHIGIISASSTLLVTLIVAALYLSRGKLHSLYRGVSRNNQDPLVSTPVELPESPNISHSMPNGIRLVCNLNTHLQNFADKLRKVLQDHIGCPVSVHTVWHTQVGSSSWIAEAKNKEEKVLFIWDKNLSLLDYAETQSVGMQRHTVHHVISTLQRNELASIVLLQLDIAESAPLPIELRHCCTFSLPGDLMELVKDFSSEAEIPPDSFRQVNSAYEEIEKNLRQNVCQSSKQSWHGNTVKHLERRPDNDDIGSDESDVSDQEVLIDEEEAGQELLSSLAHSC